MNENEDIATYLLRVDEFVNAIRGLGEELDESLVLQKVLRSLLLKYDAKVSAIEENRDLTKMKMDELHGSLTAYEMRRGIENEQSNREAPYNTPRPNPNYRCKYKCTYVYKLVSCLYEV